MLRDYINNNKVLVNGARCWDVDIKAKVIVISALDNNNELEIYRYTPNNMVSCETMHACGNEYLKITVYITKKEEDTMRKVYFTDLYTIYEKN
jgi:hypothetical protein